MLVVFPFLVAAMCSTFLIGAGSVVVEVSTATALQRCLPEDVFATACGVALPVSLVGIVIGLLAAGIWRSSSACPQRWPSAAPPWPDTGW